ncbi:SDR family NAD(P)-dependent oxidoreductase [Nakamurella aerolata]|uniref:Probable oxidoreductase n=1 Tax=Nakamurella aerolata TaxID=1656892 RepID=A0A849A9R2_9ACTN|nr:SDR family NAD(P)-dependent oxidoreductase [Nakamurella aerolata]NNG36707.1 SDR family NAD(P)-dependent oxidoreductase [Nakamurella aerolata]
MSSNNASLITTPFGFDSTTTDVARGIDLAGKRAIVTGGVSGIGTEIARALAGAGAAVTITARDVERGETVAERIRSDTGNVRVSVAALELTDLASVAALAAAWGDPLDILVNNAGVMAIPTLRRSDEGHEMQFATNHLGHFALALGLYDALAAAGAARMIAVSSSGHLRSPVVFDDINYQFRDYDPFGAYGQSKTANVLFAVEATRRWARDGITANAVHPGGIATRLQRHVGGHEYMARADERFRRAGSVLKTPQQGAATAVLLATSPQLAGVGGRYWEDCNEAGLIDRRDESGLGGVAAYALDGNNAARLWDVSLQMLRMSTTTRSQPVPEGE